MEVEDVIELGSSDEEPDPPPKKMKTLTNAMVHIPTKIHGVTIKPVRATTSKLSVPKFPGKNITVTKVTNAALIKPKQTTFQDKPVQKHVGKIVKKKVVRKTNIVQNRETVFNPLSQIKKITPQPGGSPFAAKLKNPIQILGPHALQKLAPSITVKKTGVAVKTPTHLVAKSKSVTLANQHRKPTNPTKKRKIEVMPTVDLDDEETPVPSDRPQWYMRPEEETETNHEKTNNKEPETPSFIEITIEDSPIKPPKTKRTRELSNENIITIEDSPNKPEVVNADADEGSDNEPNTSTKVPKSKKKLEYKKHNLSRIDEKCTLEIEIDPIAIDDSIICTEKESEVVTKIPDIVEVQESSVEIAQNQQGDVSVIQIKPTAPKETAVPLNIETQQDEFHPTYVSFIELCLKLENSNDMEKIVEKKIKSYYRQCPKEYTQSEEFIDMVSSKVASIKASPEKMYLYIKDIVDELNLQRKLSKQSSIQESNSKDQGSCSFGKDNEFDPSKQRQIRKLEKTLKKLNRAIQKLETQEVDFDDEEDSVYLLTEKYKERMVRVHAKFCQLTNSKMPSEPRLVIGPRPGRETGPAKRLEAWINKNKALMFPDFHDVLRCVREANNEDKLGWNEAFMMEEARDLFVRCGKKLQRRRQENEWRLATSRLTLHEDPAEKNDDLKKKLDDNRRRANIKETEVLNKFSDKQNQLKLEAEEIDDLEAEESPVESEEDSDESSSLESKQKRKDRLRRLIQEQTKKSSAQLTSPNDPETIEGKHDKVILNEIDSVDNKVDRNNKHQTVDGESNIHSLSVDSTDIGSDVDELHLLQKLHSDTEIHDVSSAGSSDSETPIAISDTLDSNSDEDDKKQQPCDIISIENSSYSDESDSFQNVSKNKTKDTVTTQKELTEESKEIGCLAESFVKKKHFVDDSLVDEVLTCSDAESNESVSLSTGKNKLSQECSKGKNNLASDKDFEPSIVSKSTELCIDMNGFEKPSDAKNEDELNSNVTNKKVNDQLSRENDNVFDTEKPIIDVGNTLDRAHVGVVIENPKIDLNCKKSTSTAVNDDVQSTNTAEETEISKKDTYLLQVGRENTHISEMYMNIDAHDDNSNSQTITIVEVYEDSPKQSDAFQSDDAHINLKKDPLLTSNKVSVGVKPIDDSNRTAIINEVHLSSTSKTWPTFKDDSTSSSIKSTDDENAIENTETNTWPGVSQSSDSYTNIKDGDICSSEQALEIASAIIITNIRSMSKTDQTDEALNTFLNPSDHGSEITSNRNSIPDLVQRDTNLSENNDIVEKEDLTSGDLLPVETDNVNVMNEPIAEQSVVSVEKILEEMFESEISAVEAPITLSPT